MIVQYFNQTLVGSCLLLSLALPIYAAKDTSDYPVVIHFSSNDDAKQMVQSTYSALVDLNRDLMTLNKYTVHSLSTGYFFEDQVFQDKKSKVIKTLDNQKLTLHVFGKQELNIDFHDPKNNRQYAIRIPVVTFNEFGLSDTNISNIDDAKEAQKAILAARQKLRDLLTPHEVTTPNFDEKQTGFNILKIKNPESFIAISNSLEQVQIFYAKKLNKLGEYADKVASGRYSEEEMQALNTEYGYFVYAMSWYIDGSEQTTINSLKIFKGSELTLNFDDKIQKSYYMPEISLSILQLDNDSIYDYYSAIKSYVDLKVAKNWMLDWNITGQQEFNPASDSDRTAYAPHFAEKK